MNYFRLALDGSGWLALAGAALCLNLKLSADAWIWLCVAPLLVWIVTHPQSVVNLLFAFLLARRL